jgi:tetratricopeptide (TPR) repeat protein
MQRKAIVVCILLAAIAALAQNPAAPAAKPSQWTLLVDPVCPVGDFYGAGAPPNVTRELRVMYFPSSEKAKLKNATKLTLQVGFDYPSTFARGTTVPFRKKDDHWEAVLPLERTQYAIFAVKDETSGVVDDNDGRFTDVVFCAPEGGWSVGGIQSRAAGYTGEGWPGIHRTKDINKAISILETAYNSDPSRYAFLQMNLWERKAERDGGDAQAWAKVSKEVEQFAAEHSKKQEMYPVLNFVTMNTQKLPADFLDRITDVLDAKMGPEEKIRQKMEYDRIHFGENDPKKLLAAFDAFIAKHPDSLEAVFAMQGRFTSLVALKDVAGAEAALTRYHEGLKARPEKLLNPMEGEDYLSLASLYINKNVKFEEALNLIEKAEECQKKVAANRDLQMSQARIAGLRARAYLGLHRYDMALPEALKAVENFKTAEGYATLARAYAGTGDRKKALDAYFDAALQPSNEDLKLRNELEQFYTKHHFGNSAQFVAEYKKRRAERFGAKKYVPQLIEKPAPELNLVTLKGERFDADALKGKPLIANFWSPG